MSKDKQAFLDYYKTHNISPVAQDISDLNKHFQRRNALYRQCGIVSSFIKGRSVLEVGPGTGHNALFTNSFRPKNYVLLDGNPKSCQETEKNLNANFKDCSNISVIQSNFWDFETETKFDLVCCEGTVPWQNSPEKFLLKLSSFVNNGGVLLITTSDAISYLSELLRRLFARIIIADSLKGEKNSHISLLKTSDVLDTLRPFFTNQLRHLKGMSRSIDDWIHDNILQPIVGKPLSIHQAINTLSKNFDIYGSSPQSLTDWRWYKDIHGKNCDYNNRALEIFSCHKHNMLDYRKIYSKQTAKFGNEVSKVANDIMNNILLLDKVDVEDYPSTLKNVVNSVIKELSVLSKLTDQYSNDTSLSIRELQQQLTCWGEGGEINMQLPNFSPWFGRGQQYLSFTKKSWFELSN